MGLFAYCIFSLVKCLAQHRHHTRVSLTLGQWFIWNSVLKHFAMCIWSVTPYIAHGGPLGLCQFMHRTGGCPSPALCNLGFVLQSLAPCSLSQSSIQNDGLLGVQPPTRTHSSTQRKLIVSSIMIQVLTFVPSPPFVYFSRSSSSCFLYSVQRFQL